LFLVLSNFPLHLIIYIYIYIYILLTYTNALCYYTITFWKGKVKVKVTLVQALRLCTGRTANKGSRGIALLFLDHGTRRGWGVSVTPRPLFTPGEDPVPIVQEAGWAPGPVRRGAENLAPTGIRSSDRPARSSVAIPTELPDPHNIVWGEDIEIQFKDTV